MCAWFAHPQKYKTFAGYAAVSNSTRTRLSRNYRGEILERTGSLESLVSERTILNIDPDQSNRNFIFFFNGLRQYAAAVRLIARGAWHNYVAPGISHFQPLLYHLHVNESWQNSYATWPFGL